ncbi:hypothetical protein CXB51_035447 [Gossypium anomalum]|uniref:C2H2-type domain-containing protein n=1 Tax=Gossypium anomalum TaxID=47600 RepID=A0A8J5XQU8_9ROSI|nr:hypothetical protein CXB51_035447 [Gossypium anomalum]
MDMDMEDSRSSSSHSIHSVAFHVYFASVRTRRFAKNLILSSPRISLVGFYHIVIQMEERRELGFPRTIACCLKEQLARTRTTLNNVRSQRHTYIELREERKRFIFFCTLCLAPCYSDSVLLDHLKGNLHTKRLAAAKVILLGTNPWPFNDGVLFFGKSNEKEKQLSVVNFNENRLLEFESNDNNLAIVKYVGSEVSSYEKNVHGRAEDSDLVIPGVLIKDEVSDLKVSLIGFGKIAARFCENGASNRLSRIWCEWLGKEAPRNDDKVKVPKHEFAVVTFVYNCDLGRKSLLDDVKSLLTSVSLMELGNVVAAGRKRKKSFSDSEDISESLSNHYDSSGEDSSASNSASSRLALDRYDDQLLLTRFISSKAIRRELRRQQRIAAERMCDICQQKMLPEKDVAALLNLKTGKLVCSSRNVNGAFHLYHTSCLIHWILLYELETIESHKVNPIVRRRYRRKNGAKCNEMGKDLETKPMGFLISSKLCSECQGTGIEVEDDKLEKPDISVLRTDYAYVFQIMQHKSMLINMGFTMFRYKIKVSDGRRAWMKSPERLESCSTGFHFPSQFGEMVQEKVLPLKLLHFYSANNCECGSSLLTLSSMSAKMRSVTCYPYTAVRHFNSNKWAANLEISGSFIVDPTKDYPYRLCEIPVDKPAGLHWCSKKR